MLVDDKHEFVEFIDEEPTRRIPYDPIGREASRQRMLHDLADQQDVDAQHEESSQPGESVTDEGDGGEPTQEQP